MFNSNTLFRPAAELKSWLRLAFVGVSGSGKTWSSLELATRLANGGKIALVDSEHGSSAKYSDRFSFDILALENYHPQHYIDAINAAAKAGYKVIILDSLSHAWSGQGGLLEMVDNIAARNKGNSFSAWKDATPVHHKLIDTIIGAQIHVIATMRAKTEYVIEENEKGKKVPRKVGMAPDQRAGLEYEFDIVGDLEVDGKLIITKTRCAAINEKIYLRPDAEFYNAVTAWAARGDGEPLATATQLQTYETLRAEYAALGLGELSAPKEGATAVKLDQAIAWAQHQIKKGLAAAANKPALPTNEPTNAAISQAEMDAAINRLKKAGKSCYGEDWEAKVELAFSKAPRTMNITELNATAVALEAMAAREAGKAAPAQPSAPSSAWDDNDDDDDPSGGDAGATSDAATNPAPKPQNQEPNHETAQQPATAPATPADATSAPSAPQPPQPAADPLPAPAGQPHQPSGSPQAAQGGAAHQSPQKMTMKQNSAAFAIADQLWNKVTAKRGIDMVIADLHLPRMSELTKSDANKLIDRLNAIQKGLLPLPEIPDENDELPRTPPAPSRAADITKADPLPDDFDDTDPFAEE